MVLGDFMRAFDRGVAMIAEGRPTVTPSTFSGTARYGISNSLRRVSENEGDFSAPQGPSLMARVVALMRYVVLRIVRGALAVDWALLLLMVVLFICGSSTSTLGDVTAGIVALVYLAMQGHLSPWAARFKVAQVQLSMLHGDLQRRIELIIDQGDLLSMARKRIKTGDKEIAALKKRVKRIQNEKVKLHRLNYCDRERQVEAERVHSLAIDQLKAEMEELRQQHRESASMAQHDVNVCAAVPKVMGISIGVNTSDEWGVTVPARRPTRSDFVFFGDDYISVMDGENVSPAMTKPRTVTSNGSEATISCSTMSPASSSSSITIGPCVSPSSDTGPSAASSFSLESSSPPFKSSSQGRHSKRTKAQKKQNKKWAARRSSRMPEGSPAIQAVQD